MFPFELTPDQKQQLEKAKASGKSRIVLNLTDLQRKIDKAYVDKIDQQVREELGIKHTHPHPLAVQLRKARKGAGLSLAEVAKRAEMTKQAILKIESGQNANPKIDTLTRIAKAIGKAIKIELVDTSG